MTFILLGVSDASVQTDVIVPTTDNDTDMVATEQLAGINNTAPTQIIDSEQLEELYTVEYEPICDEKIWSAAGNECKLSTQLYEHLTYMSISIFNSSECSK